MKVTIGDVIASEFGKGKIVAITKQWVVHEVDETGHECAISIEDECFWVPAEFDGLGSIEQTLDIEDSQ